MALIKTKQEVIAAGIKLASEFNVNDLPKWDNAEQQYLIPILGEDLYTDLSEAYNGSAMNPAQEKLLVKCQAVTANFGFIEHIINTQVLITSNGVMALQTELSRKPFKWEYNNAIEERYNRGYAAQEMLIIFLRNNKADFPLWDDSPYNSAGDFLIIRDGSDLRPVLGLIQPHRCFMLLRAIFNTHVDGFMKDILGEDFYASINNSILAETLTIQEKGLVSRLRPACARKAMQYAATELNLRFDSTGFTVVDVLKDEPNDGRTNARQDQMTRFIEMQDKAAEKLVQDAINYLNRTASVSVFPEYFASSLYKDPATPEKGIDNSCLNGFFGM